MRAIAQQGNVGVLPKKTSPIVLLHCAKHGRVETKAIVALEIAKELHQRTSPTANRQRAKRLHLVISRIVDKLEDPRHTGTFKVSIPVDVVNTSHERPVFLSDCVWAWKCSFLS